MTLSQKDQLAIFNQALENKHAFFVWWNSPAEDVVFNIKTILPELDIKELGEKQVFGNWIETISLDGQEYPFELESDSKAFDIVHLVNKKLSASGQFFVHFDPKDEGCYFILIKTADLPTYLEKGFLEP